MALGCWLVLGRGLLCRARSLAETGVHSRSTYSQGRKRKTPFQCKIQAIRLTDSPRHGKIRADFLICKPVGCSKNVIFPRDYIYYCILPHEIRIYETFWPLHETKKYHWLFTTCFAQTAHSSRNFSLFLI